MTKVMTGMKAKRTFLFSLMIVSLLSVASAGGAAESRPGEWDKTSKAAESEGDVAVYVVDYPRFTVSQFHKVFPKIRLNQIDGPSGPALTSRLMAERRAGKISSRSLHRRTGESRFGFVSGKSAGAHAAGFYLAGGERRVQMVQGQASVCRS
jgi:hypothetical protein